MRLVPCDPNDLNIRAYRRTKNLAILMEFINSDIECAKIERSNLNAYQCANSLRRSADHYGLKGVKIAVRKNEVFLLKDIVE